MELKHEVSPVQEFDGGIREVLPSLNLPFELRQYQLRGVEFLVKRTEALLADDMGLGKTVQCIVALGVLQRLSGWNRVLLVVPKSLRRNWKAEFDLWSPQLRARLVNGSQNSRAAQYLLPIPLLIATYDQVREDADLFTRREVFDLVVLDEAQRVKNRSSRTSIACTSIPRKGSWALTGTPLENSPEDLEGVFSFVRRGLISASHSVEDVHDRMSPYFLRRTAEEALPELPDRIDQTIELDLEGDQAREYGSIWATRGGGGTNPGQLLEVLTTLKQICNHLPDASTSVKLEALAVILDNAEATGSKAIVFSQYVTSLRWLQARLPNVTSHLFHGGLSEAERDVTLGRFRHGEGPSVLLMSLTAGSVGLNLQEADVVVLFDRWWNPAVEEQAVRRAYRFGRQRPLNIFRFKVRDTVEERIDDILRRKRALFEEYVEELREDPGRGFGPSELKWILEWGDGQELPPPPANQTE